MKDEEFKGLSSGLKIAFFVMLSGAKHLQTEKMKI